MVRVERIVTGKWKENCYILSTPDGSAVAIDPGADFETIRAYLRDNDLPLRAVINTHAHYDHIGAVADLVEEFSAPFHLHKDDEKLLCMANFYRTLFLGEESIRTPKLDVDLNGKKSLQFGELEIEVIHTPGHTPGSVCFLAAGELFSGDTLLTKRLGRTDLPGGDPAALLESARALFSALPPETVFHPGHGPASTLGEISEKEEEVAELPL